MLSIVQVLYPLWCFVLDTLLSRCLRSRRQAAITSILKIAVRMDANKRWMHHHSNRLNTTLQSMGSMSSISVAFFVLVIENTCRPFLLEIYDFLFCCHCTHSICFRRHFHLLLTMTFFSCIKKEIFLNLKVVALACILSLKYNAFNEPSSQPARRPTYQPYITINKYVQVKIFTLLSHYSGFFFEQKKTMRHFQFSSSSDFKFTL